MFSVYLQKQIFNGHSENEERKKRKTTIKIKFQTKSDVFCVGKVFMCFFGQLHFRSVASTDPRFPILLNFLHIVLNEMHTKIKFCYNSLSS